MSEITDEITNTFIISDEEYQLLIKAYGEDKVHRDKIDDEQITIVNCIRAVADYLNHKYTDMEFNITSIIPYMSVGSFVVCYFNTDNSDTEYSVYVQVEGDKFMCTDNYYGEMLRNNYDFKVQELVASIGIECITYTKFLDCRDLDVYNITSVDALNDISPFVRRQTFIFTDSDKKDVTGEIFFVMRDNNMLGIFTVCKTDEYRHKSIDQLIDNLSNYNRYQFRLGEEA